MTRTFFPSNPLSVNTVNVYHEAGSLLLKFYAEKKNGFEQGERAFCSKLKSTPKEAQRKDTNGKIIDFFFKKKSYRAGSFHASWSPNLVVATKYSGACLRAIKAPTMSSK